MRSFLEFYSVLVDDLNRLLRAKISPANPGTASPLATTISQVLRRHYDGAIEKRDLETMRLMLLRKALGLLEARRPHLLKEYRKHVRRQLDLYSFFGTCFELYMAAVLGSEVPQAALHLSGLHRSVGGVGPNGVGGGSVRGAPAATHRREVADRIAN